MIKFNQGDVIILKKKHPCGFASFDVLRIGSDIRIKCRGCGRDMTLERVKLEKMIKRVVPRDSVDEEL